MRSPNVPILRDTLSVFEMLSYETERSIILLRIPL